LPKYNTGSEYYFMDIFEQLILIMIIRREIINFAIKTKHYELLGAVNQSKYLPDYEETEEKARLVNQGTNESVAIEINQNKSYRLEQDLNGTHISSPRLNLQPVSAQGMGVTGPREGTVAYKN
jgi:hypothetical protein